MLRALGLSVAVAGTVLGLGCGKGEAPKVAARPAASTATPGDGMAMAKSTAPPSPIASAMPASAPGSGPAERGVLAASVAARDFGMARAVHESPRAVRGSPVPAPARTEGLPKAPEASGHRFGEVGKPAPSAGEKTRRRGDAETRRSGDVDEARPLSVPPPLSSPISPLPSPFSSLPIQSGTLTAGSFDDHQRLDDYRRYLSEVLQRDPGEKLPRMDLGRRVVILVENGQGLPVADARVVIRPADDGQTRPDDGSGSALADVTTAADGRAVFLSGMDGAKGRQKFSLAVYPPGGLSPVTQVVDIDQPVCRVQLPSVPQRHIRRLDLALVVDCTGSMGDELEYLKAEIDGIAAAVNRMFPEVDQRYALIVYRDQGDEYVTRTFDFTGSLEGFRSTLSQQYAAAGGDYPEAVHLALSEADKLSWRKEETARVLFLVGDAPPHEEFFRQAMEAVSALRHKTVRIYPVGCSGVAEQAEFIFRAAAFLTQGQYLFLTDHSGVGNPHTPPHVPDYQVERLDRLMVRMIASELAGRKLAATEIIAIEGGQTPYGPPQPIPPEQQTKAASPPPPPLFRQPSAARVSLAWFPASSAARWILLLGLLAMGKVAQDYVTRRQRPHP